MTIPQNPTQNKRGNCEVCGKKISSSMYEGACSRVCAQERLEYNFIRIPKQFARNLITRYKEEEWENELTAFAIRHKYRADLVIKKFKNTQASDSNS